MCNFFLCISFISSVQVCIFALNMPDIIIYVAWRWEKYLSKRRLIKHTCSWHDKLIVSWTLKRKAKIFLRTARSVENITPEVGVKTFQKNPLQSQERKELFRKTKSVFVKIFNLYHFYYIGNCLVNFFPGLLQIQKYQIA